MKERLLQIAVVLALFALGAWLVSATEWAETETQMPMRGEAKTNPLYATQRLLRELGGTVVQRASLDALPPPQARLVLLTHHWDALPEPAAKLRAWVEAGGHLIVPAGFAQRDALQPWVPIRLGDRRADDEEKGAAAQGTPAPAEPPEATPPKPPKQPAARTGSTPKAGTRASRDRDRDRDCRVMTEPATVAASYREGRTYRFCGARALRGFEPVSTQRALWSLEGERGVESLRVAQGRGSVTIVGAWFGFSNAQLLRGDNALVAAAALQAAPGAVWWFITDESRESFLPWLWRQGWIALVLGLLALAAALWRAAVRFGPLAAVPGQQRRSMAEQVRGTAEFLQRNGGDALHAAQVRALRDVATRQLRRQSQRTPAERDAAIAAATGIEPAVLRRALEHRARNPAVLAADLELLETARRRLDAAAPVPPSSPSSSS